ncbi:hypothetical protein TraAM80_08533 [Trypanosoma rangeli]|uniref:Uncharacterized protein n=1 Tax=Trypanosoma rangeli TaxID=5698 RepID=A0A3R7KPK2_TRYRA|nr:uncharacterized protein TraAM80_08533 [Trypanosoma rangeli]RNE98851.1 hypothetical protein TraAM80_08533 [Trypanosoma rangeli]|eukprot:RNE98851.1 hypothetical protein TraAM80_08533 [Trypanosoma rangeli]
MCRGPMPANTIKAKKKTKAKNKAKKGRKEMPSRTTTRASRSASREQRRTPSPPVANRQARAANACLTEEALAVEAILAGRPGKTGRNSSPWGMWAAVVVLEVVAFVWLKWAVDVYGVYRAARL